MARGEPGAENWSEKQLEFQPLFSWVRSNLLIELQRQK
jgi:hypothetical protein